MSTILATQVRKHAKGPAKPAGRYWKGRAPKGAEFASESDEEEEQQTLEQDVPVAGEHELQKDAEEDSEQDSFPTKTSVLKSAKINVALKDVQISQDGKVIVADRVESGRTLKEGGFLSPVFDISKKSPKRKVLKKKRKKNQRQVLYEWTLLLCLSFPQSSEESESADEKPALIFRPVFVPKRRRATITERDTIAKEAEEMQKRRELAAEERKRESHNLVAESIKRELAEKEKEEDVPDVDDTDGIDPEGEFEAWRLRELERIRKEKEEELRREEEREEIERRRALPEEQRLKEDLERAKKSREEKPKGKQKFLQKYWHKGAFHQDDEILKKHDYTEATESVVDVSMLPKVMQVRNFGKRSRTKYTHLVDQDTSAGTGGFGGVGSVKSGGLSTDGGGCFRCGGPHLKKDCPQDVAPDFARRPATNGQPDTRHRDAGRNEEDRLPTKKDQSRRLDRDDRPYNATSRRRQSRSPDGARRIAKDQEDTRDDYSTKRRRLD
ncbi:microfibrillar-associated protein MFAP1, Zn finger, CCHC type protein [Pisolithus croceorrhizus]|nr:microfibrillar-associated protein MFAP1, Zn finger, CCHC type protein [Pisolithus croceorrhizus]